MAAALAEGQYELNGFLFGAGLPTWVLAAGDVTSAVEVRDQDVEHPQADLTLMGRDHLTPPTREFLLVSGDDVDAGPEFARLRAAWRADTTRDVPLATSVLRWCRHGQTYRSYGRPRDFEPLYKEPVEPQRRYARAVWKHREAMVFVDAADTLTLDLVADSLSDGLVLPATLPWTLGRITRARDGVVTVGGLAKVPFQLTVKGPMIGAATAISLSGPGWILDFGALSLPAGQTITVDTSGVGSAMCGGVSVAGALSRASTLTGRLSPGTAEFRFVATDSSATTTATITWRPAALIV